MELRREIEILKSRCIVDDEAMLALRRMQSTLFGFGFYDPATKRDGELARLLEPDWTIIEKKFHVGQSQ